MGGHIRKNSIQTAGAFVLKLAPCMVDIGRPGRSDKERVTARDIQKTELNIQYSPDVSDCDRHTRHEHRNHEHRNHEHRSHKCLNPFLT